MNTLKSVTLILLGFLFVQLQAQNKNVNVDVQDDGKKVVIIKKTVDADGNETVEKIIKEGDDAENVFFIDEDGKTIELDGETINWEDENGEKVRIIQKEQTVDVNVDQNDGKKVIRIRTDGGDGEAFNFNWEGDEIPEDVKKDLQEKGFEIDEKDGHIMIHQGGDDGKVKVIQKMQTIDVEDKEGQKVIRIRTSGDDGEALNFNWEGDEIPEDVKKQLEEKGFNVKEENGHIMIHSGDDAVEDHIRVRKSMGHSNQAFLGVMIGQKKTVENIDGEETTTVEDAAVIEGIIENSAAEEAGLLEGDQITGIDSETISTYQDVVDVLGNYAPGDEISIAYTRAGQAMTTTATLKGATDFQNAFTYEIDDEQEIEVIIDGHEEGDVVKKKVIIIEKMDDEGAVTREEIMEPAPQNTLEIQELSIFPNPTDGQVKVEFEGNAEPTTVTLTSIAGKEFFREELKGFDGQYSRQINVSDAPKGALFLTIKQGNKAFTEKIIVE